MNPDVDYTPEPGQPIVITHEQARISIWVVIARAVVSFTLLAVLLLAFGVAISGWFMGNSIRDDAAHEIERTPIQAQMVIAYRDALITLTDRMETERTLSRRQATPKFTNKCWKIAKVTAPPSAAPASQACKVKSTSCSAITPICVGLMRSCVSRARPAATHRCRGAIKRHNHRMIVRHTPSTRSAL